MSDFFSDNDEVISAHLDGEAAGGEGDRITRDPQSRARAAELAAVKEAVSVPVAPLPAAERDRLRITALAAAAPDPAGQVRGRPRLIEAARGHRRSMLIPVAAAAVIVAVAFGVTAVYRGLNDDSEQRTASVATEDSADFSALESSAAEMGDDAAGAVTDEMTADADEPASDDAADDMADMAESESAEPVMEAQFAGDAATDDEADLAGSDRTEPSVIDLGSFSEPDQIIHHLTLLLASDPPFTGPDTEPGACADAITSRTSEMDGDVVGRARAELRLESDTSPAGPNTDLAVVMTQDQDRVLVYATAPSCDVTVAALN